MITRRSFFRRLAAVVAAVAIAPEIAFRHKLDLAKLDIRELHQCLYDLMRRREQRQTFVIFTDKETSIAFNRAMIRYYTGSA